MTVAKYFSEGAFICRSFGFSATKPTKKQALQTIASKNFSRSVEINRAILIGILQTSAPVPFILKPFRFVEKYQKNLVNIVQKSTGC
jgi:hypothetical protein